MSTRRGHEDTAEDLAVLVTGIQRTTRHSIRRDLDLEPLSGAQGELLRLALSCPGISVSAAARELHLAGNSVSSLVNKLVGDGYLERRPDRADRRVALLTVTGAGRERLKRWADRRTLLIADRLGELDPAQVASIEAALPALRALATLLARPHTAVEAGP